MKRISILFSIFIIINNVLHAMETTLSAHNYLDLLDNNAQFLKNLIQEESAGVYCEQLSEAEKTLRYFFEEDIENKLGAELGPIWSDETIHLARIIARRPIVLDMLHRVCTKYAIDDIKKIVNENPRILQSYYSDNSCFGTITLLHRAIEHPYSNDVIETLLLLGANSNARARRLGLSPLHVVKSKNIAKLLLRYGADVNQKSKANKSPLYYALMFREKKLSLAHYFIKHGADINEVCDAHNGNTLLHKAVCTEGMAEVVKLLLDNGADVQKRNNEGETAFDCVEDWMSLVRYYFERYYQGIIFRKEAQEPYKNIVKLLTNAEYFRLLGRNESIWARERLTKIFIMLRKNSDKKERRACHGIVVNHRGYIFNHATFEDLEMIVGKESVDWMKKYLQDYYHNVLENMRKYPFKAIKVNETNVFAYDPVIAFEAFSSMIRLGTSFDFRFCSHDFDLSGIDVDGNSLLHLAIQHKNMAMIKYLLDRQIDLVLTRNFYNETPWDRALVAGETTLAVFIRTIILQMFNSDPWAVSKKIKEFFVKLVDANRYAEELLLLRAVKSYHAWTPFLLKRGVPVNKTDNTGKSALLWVVEEADCFTSSDRRNYLQLLLRYGAVVSKDMLKYTETEPWVHVILQKAYDEQECCVCLEHPDSLSDIPCKNTHKDHYLCGECYSKLGAVKVCPICRENMMQFD